MLSFSRKTDYALIALADLAGRGEQIASAREIADNYRLPRALVKKILKGMHRAGIIQSVRGVNGGYRLAADLHAISLFDLIDILQETSNRRPSEPPLLAVYGKLVQFLKDVKLVELLPPGHRIDVPIALVGFRKMQNEPTSMALAG